MHAGDLSIVPSTVAGSGAIARREAGRAFWIHMRACLLWGCGAGADNAPRSVCTFDFDFDFDLDLDFFCNFDFEILRLS